MKDKARKPTTTPGSEPPPAEGLDLPERWSIQRKTELALDAVSRESQVPAHESSRAGSACSSNRGPAD